MSEPNPDLLAVSQALNDLATSIHLRKDETTDFELYRALNDELVEINHRIGMVGGLIFRARADRIATAAASVADSRAEILDAVATLDTVNHVVKSISAFLGLVDNVIDVAKRVVLV